MAKRKYIHHGSKRDVKKDLGSNATACATLTHSINDGQAVEVSITANTTLNLVDVWDGARVVIAATSACCGTLTVKVNGTAVDAVTPRAGITLSGLCCVAGACCAAAAIGATSFTNCDVNVIYVDIIDDGSDVHPALFTTI